MQQLRSGSEAGWSAQAEEAAAECCWEGEEEGEGAASCLGEVEEEEPACETEVVVAAGKGCEMEGEAAWEYATGEEAAAECEMAEVVEAWASGSAAAWGCETEEEEAVVGGYST